MSEKSQGELILEGFSESKRLVFIFNLITCSIFPNQSPSEKDGRKQCGSLVQDESDFADTVLRQLERRRFRSR